MIKIIKTLICAIPMISVACCAAKTDEEKTALFVNKLMQEQHIVVAQTKNSKQENTQNVTEIDKAQQPKQQKPISIAPNSNIKSEPLSTPPSNLANPTNLK